MKWNLAKISLLLIFVICCVAFANKVTVKSGGLPTTGTITMDMIRTELGIPATTNFSLDAARKGLYVPLNPYSPTLPPESGPVKLTDWYGYCHSCTGIYPHEVFIGAVHPGFLGYTSAADACSGVHDYGITVYSSSSTLGVGSTLYSLYDGKYRPFRVYDYTYSASQWIYTSSGSKPIRLNGSNTVDAVDVCSYTLSWQLDNQTSSTDRVLQIYKNGTMIVSRDYNSSGSFSFLPGDTIRVIIYINNLDPVTEFLTISGGVTHSSSTSYTMVDTGDKVATGSNISVMATITY
jgi:hypothetical protein